jgi:hypothetical protein
VGQGDRGEGAEAPVLGQADDPAIEDQSYSARRRPAVSKAVQPQRGLRNQ